MTALPTPDPITLRIVVDGASSAGKTSTARSLAERLGRPVTTPAEEADGRTLWFDWLEHVGGRADGRPLLTQVVTVPGHLPDRRRYLVATADAVLFVADASTAGLAASQQALAELRAMVADAPAPRPGILVQANKRDLPGPDLAAVRDALALTDDEDLVETRALEGDGVRQAFVYAVRIALRRREAATGERPSEVVADPDALRASMEEAEGSEVSGTSETSQVDDQQELDADLVALLASDDGDDVWRAEVWPARDDDTPPPRVDGTPPATLEEALTLRLVPEADAPAPALLAAPVPTATTDRAEPARPDLPRRDPGAHRVGAPAAATPPAAPPPPAWLSAPPAPPSMPPPGPTPTASPGAPPAGPAPVAPPPPAWLSAPPVPPAPPAPVAPLPPPAALVARLDGDVADVVVPPTSPAPRPAPAEAAQARGWRKLFRRRADG